MATTFLQIRGMHPGHAPIRRPACQKKMVVLCIPLSMHKRDSAALEPQATFLPMLSASEAGNQTVCDTRISMGRSAAESSSS